VENASGEFTHLGGAVPIGHNRASRQLALYSFVGRLKEREYLIEQTDVK
jgi:hypothetical protein